MRGRGSKKPDARAFYHRPVILCDQAPTLMSGLLNQATVFHDYNTDPPNYTYYFTLASYLAKAAP
jgi:hypothetical protein